MKRYPSTIHREAIRLKEPKPGRARPPFELDRKAVFGWTMFDFANSSFTTVMITAFFSLYFMNEVVPASAAGPDRGPALWGLAIAISQTIVILTAPLLGAQADFSGAKKKFLFATYLGCAGMTIALGYFAQPGAVAVSMALFIGANICFSSGENFISAFLPEIAPPQLIGRISGLAWGMGYIGGIGSLLLSVYLLSDAGLGEAGYPWVWVMIGLWFLLAGVPTFLFVEERHRKEEMPEGQTLATVGFHRLARTVREGRRFRQLFRFLMTYTIYISGVTAVITFASKIADEALGFTTTELGIFLVVLNASAALGAWGGGFLMDLIGSRRAIILALCGWLLALVLAAFVQGGPNGAAPSQGSITIFWIAGNVVGLSMGATFASSRALVGLFSPEDRTGEFFGLWGLFGKLGAIIGPLLFGVTATSFGIQAAVLSLALPFIAGLVLMRYIDEDEGCRAARVRGTEA
jgi:UMF1 family MFS transporter